MSGRPYFKKSIKELEALFASHTGSQDVLADLNVELGFRKTQRALALKDKVLAATESAPDKPEKGGQPSLELSQTHEVEQPPTEPVPTEPDKITARRSDLGPKPPVENDPENILRAWTALEVLSPQGYRRETDLTAGNKTLIARFDERDLPWNLGEKSKPKKRLYYELILGAIALGPAVESLLKLYSDNRPDMPSMKRDCPIASILLDKEGRPLEEDNCFAISSFAWGVPVALQGDLKKLADWPVQEKHLMAAFKKRLVRRDRYDEVLPLSKTHINELFNHLVTALRLEGHEIKAPYFALRRYEFFASKSPPEPSLLNSFFLEDLAVAQTLVKTDNLPRALKHYLGIRKPYRQTDLLKDDAGLQHLLQPALTSTGRWPSKGRFPLALLQQAAINATDKRLMETGILAVNGPPGTGKTTLLRDVVAARIIERANVLSEYKKPSEAFKPTNQALIRNKAKITLHKLDAKLKGFEMVVASSNNKAVENVSAELPAMDAIAQDSPDLRYFKTISDNVLERDTWGIIAAVLGNSSNRFLFSQSFWRDEENGLHTYLNQAVGIPQILSETLESGQTIKRNRVIVDQEKPPTGAREAQGRWEKARTDYLQTIKKSRESQRELQKLHVNLVRLFTVAEELNELFLRQPILEEEASGLETKFARFQQLLDKATTALASSVRNEQLHLAERPGFFSRLLRTQRYQHWRNQHDQFTTAVEIDRNTASDCKKEFESVQAALSANQKQTEDTHAKIAALEAENLELELQIEHARDERGICIPDAKFFSQKHEDVQMAGVWFNDAANHLRDRVFEAAIALHRAFIDCAADPLRQNLSIIVESFGTRSLGTPQKDALIAELWASFFLVVPVVSTTFASVHRMFSRLQPESLGWLLVDEAGQALPQAAVGAMMRTKNSVVVGDPLQIEPVVTLPNGLTEEICGFFGIDPLKYNAPEASVQTVADASSMYCARFPTGGGYRNVGTPLLVHRRCDSPMFEISNEIAYSNLMVQAKKPTPDNPILGPSGWIDVVGNPGPDKWCADEAVVLIDRLRQLRTNGGRPDLYIVTPFVIVQNNLRQELLNSGVLDGWVENPNQWVLGHVGTVHTVQGREAEIVFFVLGAQLSSQHGARGWAGTRPNLVNVAVTRAKASLYIIGNRLLWKDAGVFSVLDRHL